MYKGKNIKRLHEEQIQKNRQFLIQAGIDIRNPPNPYDLIKNERLEAKNNKNNNSIPYKWAREQNYNQSLTQQDPIASITITRAEMSRQGFQRQINQSQLPNTHNQYQSSDNTNNFNRNPQASNVNSFSKPNQFQFQTTNNNQIPNSNKNKNNDWFEELFEDSNPNPFPQQNRNYQTHQQKSSFDQNQYNYHQEQKNYPQSNYSQYNRQIVEQKPVDKKFRAKDLFRKQPQNIQHERPSQRIHKNHQKLEGLLECDKTKNLNTLKLLESVQAPTIKNYVTGDVKMWEINNQYPDYKLQEALKNFPHVKEFKNNQKAIIKCALNGNDVFICIPTGGGKSLIFQLMTFIKKGIYLCVLPLVSLIYDQELQAQKYRIEAYSLTGATDAGRVRKIYSKIQNYQPGQTSILIFCTPQKIASSQNFLQLLTSIYHKGCLQQIIIDEVHCVSTWGKEFRKEYENLSALKEFFPKIPILGLTATVTQKVKIEIIEKLRLKNCNFFQSSFNRPNLMYEVRPKSKRSAVQQIQKILSCQKQNSGIIYCLSKKQCQQMCKSLNSRGYMTAYYHSDLHDKEKREVQLMWMEDKIRIIIATIAFGMGINKPDVRFVIHNSLSKSLQGYYQESGRAGRDGLPAKCILFYQRSDRTALQTMILKNDYSSAQQKFFCNQQLAQMVKYCEQKYMCRRQFQLNYLGEKDFDPANCNKTCDNCQKGLVSKNFQCISQAREIVRLVQFVVDSKEKITKSQLISTLKGKDPNKYHKILKYPRLSEVRAMFKFWSVDHLEELLLELLTYEILKQHTITAKIKFGNVTNIYIEYNSVKSRKFMDQVETFPMRRVMRAQIPGREHCLTRKLSFDIDELFSDSDEEKNFGQKQTSDDLNMNQGQYDQIDYSSMDEMGIDLGQFSYEEKGINEHNEIKTEHQAWDQIKTEHQEWDGSSYYGRYGYPKVEQKIQAHLSDQELQQRQARQREAKKSSIDFIMKLFEEDDEFQI